MTAAAGPYKGMTPEKCREAFVSDLQAAGMLIQKKEGYTLNVRYSSGTEIIDGPPRTPVEYLPKEQWFIDLNRPAIKWKTRKMSLREVMEDVVRSGDLQFVQEKRKKQYVKLVMMQGDWPISRQACGDTVHRCGIAEERRPTSASALLATDGRRIPTRSPPGFHPPCGAGARSSMPALPGTAHYRSARFSAKVPTISASTLCPSSRAVRTFFFSGWRA